MMLTRLSLLIIATSLFSGCSSTPKANAPIVDGRTGSGQVSTPQNVPSQYKTKGTEIFNIAQSYIGVPYLYGGQSPSGFDCSGLVQFAHSNAGINVPRTAAAQYDAAASISQSELKPGDVIFFRISWRKISHVGIYAGQGRFIHAPTSGKRVSFSSLNEPYWQKRVAKTGRFY